VQDTLRRAIERPPLDRERELRPWLVRVAINLARDALRQRRRRGYEGTWLPSPIETPEADYAAHAPSAEARYGQLESVTFAFLLALEALTPSQRAVLLLRDVFDYSVDETAAALQLSAANVKTTLHRARKALSLYDSERIPPTPERVAQARKVLQAFCMHLMAHNVPALEALLADGVCARNDGNGEFFAAKRPVLGRDKVILFHVKIRRRERARFDIRLFNGWPALIGEAVAEPPPRIARRVVVQLQLDHEGKVRQIDSVVASRKLVGLAFDRLAEPSAGMLLEALGAALTNPSPRSWAPAAGRQMIRAARERASRAVATLRLQLRRRRSSDP